MSTTGTPNTTGINVKVSRFTESVTVPVTLANENQTVADALKAAGLTLEADETVMVNGQDADLDDVLKTGDIVTLANKPVGGR